MLPRCEQRRALTGHAVRTYRDETFVQPSDRYRATARWMGLYSDRQLVLDDPLAAIGSGDV